MRSIIIPTPIPYHFPKMSPDKMIGMATISNLNAGIENTGKIIEKLPNMTPTVVNMVAVVS
jgi:hypothetical protein